MVSIVFIFATIFVETWLYIIKQGKVNRNLAEDRKKMDSALFLNGKRNTIPVNLSKKQKVKK